MDPAASHQSQNPPAEIAALVERFSQQRDAYLSGRYNETQLRRDFLDPLFEALGWDMTNRKNYSEKFREVVHEVSVEVEGQAKAADYAFQSGGNILFFLEAKKPSVNIATQPEPAFQIRRYAWSAKIPVSLLSDFEQLAVYDCRAKPVHGDPAHTGRVRLYSYTDYVEIWDEIYGLLSHQAVHQGSLDRLVENLKAQRGTADVDDDFLVEMERWREELARNIALRNPTLSQREINHAVQLTIDRIIFLRICEERGIEAENALRDATDGKDVYGDLLVLFKQADKKYNSGLFHFSAEKGRTSHPDTLTPNIRIDDRVLKDILANLYYPKSPYAFKYIPADILGQVYERFLGKIITLSAGHRATVVEKPEVRKAGGVYYTPTYIVDYIVKNTVGELLKDKDPEALQSTPLRVLDPACGSGSFLLGAYQYLLDWYQDWYSRNNPEKWARGKNPPIFETRGGWQLTMEKKKDILTRHIFGVDIDAQAVEVTKLSLLLKVVENPGQLSLIGERILPDLGDNIKCGNSLIGPDYYEDRQMAMFDPEEQYRVNAFDWRAEFPQVFRDGGFDAVIGNPPYIFTRNEGISREQKEYYYNHYNYQSVQLNTFGIFLERSHNILQSGGKLGFITPNNWLTIDSFSGLRKFLCESTRDLEIINILDQVFDKASVDTAITIFTKGEPTILRIGEMKIRTIERYYNVDLMKIKPPAYIIQINLLKDPDSLKIINKIECNSEPLSNFSIVSTGLKAYQVGKGKPAQTVRVKANRIFHAKYKVNETYGRYLDGVDVRRYKLSWSGEYLSYGDWLAEPRKSVPFSGERILVRQIPSKPPYLIQAVFTGEPYYNDINSMVIFHPRNGYSLLYLLGIINSRLISYWFLKEYDKLQRKIFPQFKVNELEKFPVRAIIFLTH